MVESTSIQQARTEPIGSCKRARITATLDKRADGLATSTAIRPDHATVD